MITKSNKIKIWVLSSLDLMFFLAGILFFKADVSALGIFSMLPKLAFAYLITIKNKKWAIWLWVASLVLTIVIDLIHVPGEIRGISFVLTTTFLAILIRCFLQWSARLWRNADRQISQRLLNFWIYSEGVLLMITTSTILTFLLPKEYSNLASMLSIFVVTLLYRKIKQYFSIDLNSHKNSLGSVIIE